MKTIKLGYEGDEVAFLCQALVRGGYWVVKAVSLLREKQLSFLKDIFGGIN